MIQTIIESIDDKDKLDILSKIITNISKNPDEKYRKLKCDNNKLKQFLFSDDNIMLILQLLSFEKTEMEGDDCYFLA